jgi:hypothetical protein
MVGGREMDGMRNFLGIEMDGMGNFLYGRQALLSIPSLVARVP